MGNSPVKRHDWRPSEHSESVCVGMLKNLI
jgi:hypothetical protein